MGAYRCAISCGRPDEESALQEYPHGLPVCPSPCTQDSCWQLQARRSVIKAPCVCAGLKTSSQRRGFEHRPNTPVHGLRGCILCYHVHP